MCLRVKGCWRTNVATYRVSTTCNSRRRLVPSLSTALNEISIISVCVLNRPFGGSSGYLYLMYYLLENNFTLFVAVGIGFHREVVIDYAPNGLKLDSDVIPEARSLGCRLSYSIVKFQDWNIVEGI